MIWCHLQIITLSQNNKLTQTHIFHIFPICPNTSTWSFHRLSRLMNMRVIYTQWELGSAGVHITFRCVGRFDVDLVLLMRGQTELFYPFIYPGLAFVYSSNEGGISNAYQVAEQTCLFKIFPFRGQSIRNSYFSLSAARECKLACPSGSYGWTLIIH